jgi:CRISPR-associated protein Cas2
MRKGERSKRQPGAPEGLPPLCGYRLMWLMVMFDLPVDTAENRKAANDFRHRLLDFGFERCQFSVYVRFCEGREQLETWTGRVRSELPPGGKVYCLAFTDKQYGRIVRFEGRRPSFAAEKPEQYVMF